MGLSKPWTKTLYSFLQHGLERLLLVFVILVQ